MKRHNLHTFKTNVSKFSVKLFATAFLFIATANTTNAMNSNPEEPIIRHLGKTNDSNYFQVKYNNESGDKFAVIIKEKFGAVLFQEVYTAQNFDKKFRLPKNDDQGSLVFIIKNLKDNKVESYEINTNTRIVEEVVIKKVD
jgi:hypothetical protein